MASIVGEEQPLSSLDLKVIESDFNVGLLPIAGLAPLAPADDADDQEDKGGGKGGGNGGVLSNTLRTCLLMSHTEIHTHTHTHTHAHTETDTHRNRHTHTPWTDGLKQYSRTRMV